MGPGELSALIEIVEWRFVGRQELAHLGLDAEQRRRLQSKRTELMFEEIGLRMAETPNVEVEAEDMEQLRAEIEKLREEIDSMVEEAQANRGLHAATRRILEGRRTEIEALAATGIESLESLSKRTLPFGIERKGDWRSGGRGSDD